MSSIGKHINSMTIVVAETAVQKFTTAVWCTGALGGFQGFPFFLLLSFHVLSSLSLSLS